MSIVSMEGAAAISWAEAAEVLTQLKHRCGLDFFEYRRETVRRRIGNHMLTTRSARFEDYLRLLCESSTMPGQLLERITIKVSCFYRNPATFDSLRDEVLPELVQRTRPLRIWSLGCGRGEEPYTLAMLLHERGLEGRIDAGDLDPAALRAAECGRYPLDSASELPAALASRYLHRVNEGMRQQLQIDPVLRPLVHFRQQDALGSEAREGGAYDLICCRNLLIYLQPQAQLRVLAALCERLVPGGVLCLGEAEWPPPQLAGRLQPLARHTRLFRRVDEVPA